ncbi:MAG: head GIN domain-containing protein [Pelobium sp.]
MKRISYLFAFALMMVAVTATPSKATLINIHQLDNTTETRAVKNFDAISSSGSFNILVKIDGTETLKLEGNAEDLEKIETVVENGTLKIKTKKVSGDNWNWKFTGKINVYISAKQLNSLAMNGSGNIKVDGKMDANSVALRVNGSGMINTAIKAETANVSVNGSGNINVSGDVDDLKVSIAGSGSMRGNNLKSSESNVKIAGSGNASFGVEKTLNATIAGSGSVRYSGDPTLNVSKAGSGSVSKMK